MKMLFARWTYPSTLWYAQRVRVKWLLFLRAAAKQSGYVRFVAWLSDRLSRA